MNRVEESYHELDEFITDEIWKQQLQLHLKATDFQMLRKNSIIISKLGIFIKTTIKTVLIAMKNNEDTQIAIRQCDEGTVDLQIPTKLGIVSMLPVRDLLDC